MIPSVLASVLFPAPFIPVDNLFARAAKRGFPELLDRRRTLICETSQLSEVQLRRIKRRRFSSVFASNIPTRTSRPLCTVLARLPPPRARFSALHRARVAPGSAGHHDHPRALLHVRQGVPLFENGKLSPAQPL